MGTRTGALFLEVDQMQCASGVLCSRSVIMGLPACTSGSSFSRLHANASSSQMGRCGGYILRNLSPGSHLGDGHCCTSTHSKVVRQASGRAPLHARAVSGEEHCAIRQLAGLCCKGCLGSSGCPGPSKTPRGATLRRLVGGEFGASPLSPRSDSGRE